MALEEAVKAFDSRFGSRGISKTDEGSAFGVLVLARRKLRFLFASIHKP